ncbi:MAG: phosphoribosylanthranilate isomerase [Chryseobacterium sp.]|jgi:phosphoribosylanthranilate isomerase|uniref:phosphoribosylanthranilate isomerase n=1 Tax=Chryseobacterium sp. TaxID=1871047 RepID=UPI00281DB804|nr:phosphoribosylanthranilate isomerase [Chryseobacterium sp.]MDR2238349.1 phosphoribosylanthranilate isomerase [Chryseobacterium sp.]
MNITMINLSSKLKVCGLTQPDQIKELISMKIDFLGFIFYEKSPRYVLHHLSLKDISEIDHPGKTGVFVNEETDRIVESATTAGLHFIQLHGDENKDFVHHLKEKLPPKTEIIKVIRIGNHDQEARHTIQNLLNDFCTSISYFLFDTDSSAFGGTGKQFEWSLLNELEIPLPYFLSGGISEDHFENIQHLKQKPFAIDINSKFETSPGHKDVKKIKKLFRESPEGTI